MAPFSCGVSTTVTVTPRCLLQPPLRLVLANLALAAANLVDLCLFLREEPGLLTQDDAGSGVAVATLAAVASGAAEAGVS